MKLFLQILLITIINYTLLAQQPSSADSLKLINSYKQGFVRFGIKAGYNHSNIYGEDVDYIFAQKESLWKPGFHIGLLINSELNKYFWLKHELLFSRRGAFVKIQDSIHGIYQSPFNTYYIDLFPISPTFHVKGFQIYIGPYVGALIYSDIQRKDVLGNSYYDESLFGTADNFEDKNKYLQKFDFGAHGGLEYQFSFGLNIGMKFMLGLTDIFQFANSYTLEDSKTDNISISHMNAMVSIGYLFPNKKQRLIQ